MLIKQGQYPKTQSKDGKNHNYEDINKELTEWNILYNMFSNEEIVCFL